MEKSRARSLSCPVCRGVTRLEGAGTSQFPVAYQVNGLVDIYHENTPLARSSSEQPQTPACCSVHTTQPLALYCETCQKVSVGIVALLPVRLKNMIVGI